MLTFVSPAFAEKVATLQEINKPWTFFVDQDRFYISETVSVYIYSLKDFKLIKKFGRRGEGPGEFTVVNKIGVNIQPDYDKIQVTDAVKSAFFTKSGKLIKELKGNIEGSNFLYVGNNFVGRGWVSEGKKDFEAINLYDSNFKKLKEVFRKEFFSSPPEKYNVHFKNYLDYYAGYNKIFITAEHDFIIRVYDSNGKPEYTIKKDYPLKKITKEDKADYHKSLKLRFTRYEEIKHKIRFTPYFPAIQRLIIRDKKVYAIMWETEKEDSECFIFDLNGKFLKKVFLPLKKEDRFHPYLYAIANRKLYQLLENLDNETWELHITELDL
jgi:hypothetical protein